MKTERKTYHHGHLKSELLGAALLLLRQHGPAGFTTRELALRCGVSSGAMFKHFKTKDELLKELARIGFERLADCLAGGALGSSSSHSLDMFQDYRHWAQENSSLYALMFSFPLRDGSPLMAAASKVAELFDKAIAAYQVRDHVDGWMLWSAWHGLTIFRLNGFMGATPC